MGKLRDNLNLIFSNLLFGANFSIYVSLVRNWFDFRQLFLLQVGAAALFFIPFALLSPRTPRMRWADLKNILIVTVLIIYGWMYTMLWGATYTNPVDASILATLGPVFTLLIAVGMHREPFSWDADAGCSRRRSAARASCSSNGDSHLVEGSEGWGKALVLIAVLSIAANTVIIKPQLQRFGTLLGHGVVLSHRRGDHLPLFQGLYRSEPALHASARRTGRNGYPADLRNGTADVPALSRHGAPYVGTHGALSLHPAVGGYDARPGAASGDGRSDSPAGRRARSSAAYC